LEIAKRNDVANAPLTMLEVIQYLRDLAHDCARIARDCPYPRTSRVLEELAVDIMAKAKEIEDLYGW
jgi:hypothetical protein